MPVTPCTFDPPVSGIVTFDPAAFKVLYPEFAGLDNALLTNAFGLATLILNNTCLSRVSDANQREVLLNLLTAHVAFLTYGKNDGAGTIVPPPGIIGRINTAAEGTVSVGAEFGGNGGPTQDWYLMSTYGALYWVATAAYRTAIYVPAPMACGPYGGYGGPGCGC